jgi:outer membrane protein assembly factor BamD (BamD/ComL family)
MEVIRGDICDGFSPFEMRVFLGILLLGFLTQSNSNADLLDDAMTAHRAGIPEVSITKLRKFLASNSSPERAKEAKILLARCLIETQKAAEATEVLNQVEGPEAEFLKAQEALRSHRWSEAVERFAHLLKDAGPFLVDAGLGLASARKALGQTEAALETLRPLLQSGKSMDPKVGLLAAEIYLSRSENAKAEAILSQIKTDSPKEQFELVCLRGEIALQSGNLEAATASFSQILSSSEHRTPRVVAVAQLGLVKILVQKQEFEEAETSLEKLISEQPRNALLPELFQNLFEVYSRESNPSTSELNQWAAENAQIAGSDRPAYALYYLALLQLGQGSKVEAEQSLRQLSERFPNHPIVVDGILTLSRLLQESGHFDEAVKQLSSLFERFPNLSPSERYRIEYRLAEIYHRTGEFVSARDLFRALSEKSGSQREAALYNWAICSLELGDDAGFEEAFRALEKLKPADELVGDLLLARGVLEAKTGKSSAEDALEKFIKLFPKHPKAEQARLIQAELEFAKQPPDFKGAAGYLRKITATADLELAEKKDRLKFFVAASDPSSNIRAIQALAQEYFEKYPASPFKAEVRLKLGEIYFRESDFPNAQTQFELVGEENPESPLVETALFLAGEAARKSLNSASVDRAVSLFEEVYKLGGGLKFQARLEEALTMRQARQQKEAIVLLDDLLAQNPPPDIRLQALDAKGEAQFTLAVSDSKLYEEAAKTFDSLVSSEGVSVEWKERALYQKGKCLEKLGKADEALTDYYDVLATEDNTGDQLWYFRAGFDAAQILEERHSWNSAASIYEKLANTRGARSDEAKDRLTRLRLEHFLWPE